MFTPILIAAAGAFVSGYALAVLRYGYLRHDVERLRERYRELLNELARLERRDDVPQFETLRVLPGGRR